MNRMSRNVKFAYVIISILHTSRADVQLTAVAGRPYSANFSVGVIDLFPAVWTEYITSSAGSNILQQGFPLEGPRQSRYNQTYSTGNGKTELMFTEVQLDDGGRYVFTISVGTGTFETVVDILVVDDMVCNVTELHVVTDGETITYTCSYKYQGLMVPNKTKWEGAGVSISCCKVSNWTREAVPLAPPGSCYTGNATFSVSLKVSPALNGTRHSCTIYDDSGNAEGVRFITGQLIVQCKQGYNGPNCNERDSCEDFPCQNGASCEDTAADFNCLCTDQYSGAYCTIPVRCAQGRCKNGATCTDDADNAFKCTCRQGYTGNYCEQDVVTASAPCHSTTCKNGGECNGAVDGHECKCTPKYSGVYCTIPVRCEPTLCMNGGSCVEDATSAFSCTCFPGYNGTYCELEPARTTVQATPAFEQAKPTSTSQTQSSTTFNQLTTTELFLEPVIAAKEANQPVYTSSIRYIAFTVPLLLILSILLAAYLFYRRRKRKHKKADNSYSEDNSYSADSTTEKENDASSSTEPSVSG